MWTGVIAALLGAAVGFAGTYLLQRGQWRRGELADLRLRLGALRALRIDLYSVLTLLTSSIDNGVIAPGTHYPDEAWRAHGHLIVAALKPEPLETLTQVYGRLKPLNGVLAAQGTLAYELDREECAVDRDSLGQLAEKVDMAAQVLDRLEQEWIVRERRLRWPLREAFRRGRSRLRVAAPR
ncbi:MAG TPA: hypothetical protein VGH14_11660 [Solirubrobacterales bacterium]